MEGLFKIVNAISSSFEDFFCVLLEPQSREELLAAFLVPQLGTRYPKFANLGVNLTAV
jgi:hypothetical protein